MTTISMHDAVILSHLSKRPNRKQAKKLAGRLGENAKGLVRTNRQRPTAQRAQSGKTA